MVVYSQDQIEQHRLKSVAELDASHDEEGWRDRNAPGSFGCHETLHMSAYLMNQVGRELLDHGAILQNPDWYRLASEACTNLFNLYQAIGEAHLDGEGDA